MPCLSSTSRTYGEYFFPACLLLPLYSSVSTCTYSHPHTHRCTHRNTIQLYTVNVLKKWLQLYRADFDKDMLDRLAELCQYTVCTCAMQQ
jgi:hypothetical protein